MSMGYAHRGFVMKATAKEKVARQLKTGWHTAAMLAHCTGCSKSTAQKAIRELRKERSDVRKLSVQGSGYYCIGRQAH